MSRWRVPLAGLLAWLAVVAVGSTAVWWVISRVGEDLGPGRPASEVVPDVEPGRTSGPAPAPASRPPSAHPPAGVPPVVTHRQTWSGRGGYVTVRCRGPRAGLTAAQPDPGYAVAVTSRGPATVAVSFTGRSEDDGRHVAVRAGCVGGRPSFEVGPGGGDE